VLATRRITKIDPFLKIVCYPKDLTPTNLNTFLTADHPIDVLIEECDKLEMKLKCRLRTRKLRIPVIIKTNDRATLDVERFDRELAGHVHADRVREDFMSGVRSGVNGTPSFYVNGAKYDGDYSLEALLAELERAAT